MSGGLLLIWDSLRAGLHAAAGDTDPQSWLVESDHMTCDICVVYEKYEIFSSLGASDTHEKKKKKEALHCLDVALAVHQIICTAT